MPKFFHEDETRVIDRLYVIFTTMWGRHLLSGARLDVTEKSRLLHINAEPTLELTSIRLRGHADPVDVWIPKVILRDEEDNNHLYQVVYDPKWVVSDDRHPQLYQDEATQLSDYYDPITRQ